jgi:predicted ATPase
MLVAISGSQGSGKTTVINELATYGFPVVERKTARSVMTEQFPGLTLEDIYADVNLAVKWQDLILERKIEDEREYVRNDHLCFTERSYADLFTYAAMAISKNNHHSAWVDNYFDRCMAQNKRYVRTFYIHGGKFKPANDGVRGVNQHYSTMIDVSMYAFLKQMTRVDGNNETWSYQYTDVERVNIKDRVKDILTASMNYFLEARNNQEVYDGD